MTASEILARTEALCPVCLKRLPASLVAEAGVVRLVRDCPDHGRSTAVVWRGGSGGPEFSAWQREARPLPPASPRPGEGLGCPLDCGLCPEHGQRTCTVLVEVTERCRLACPVCFASAGEKPPPDPTFEELGRRFDAAYAAAGPVILQLSGGEPCERPDLPELVARARSAGFPYVQLNTNGLALAADPAYAVRLAKAGLSWVFLQFDGVSDAVYRTIRGRPLLSQKLVAVESAAAANLGVVLVATVVPGVNDRELGALADLASALTPAVRGLHFQPVSYFGRYPHPTPNGPGDADRLTLPEVMAGLEAQTGGRLKAADLHPPGCEHPRCSFSGHFLVDEQGRFTPLARAGCCGPDPALIPGEGARLSPLVVSRRWSAAPQAGDAAAPEGSLDAFIAAARRRSLSVSAMAFQDAWTLDIARLKRCCVHVAAPGGRLIPFCAWNLTASDGRPAHRGRP